MNCCSKPLLTKKINILSQNILMTLLQLHPQGQQQDMLQLFLNPENRQ
ncbi:unnamed protein product [Paramecium sonneborni]|uniref:Uncharacterized protein n=1 Tax=Paramecium sonneborni TaxID=65129 RepID=A0A8S1KHW6_9CILI|nr:unnamed protein product [Paramecium sonneborni]